MRQYKCIKSLSIDNIIFNIGDIIKVIKQTEHLFHIYVNGAEIRLIDMASSTIALVTKAMIFKQIINGIPPMDKININEYFIDIAEHREIQINSILDD